MIQMTIEEWARGKFCTSCKQPLRPNDSNDALMCSNHGCNWCGQSVNKEIWRKAQEQMAQVGFGERPEDRPNLAMGVVVSQQPDGKWSDISNKAKTDKANTGLSMVPMYSVMEIGKIFVEGLRYGKDNWKKGVNDLDFQEERLEHALLHLMKWKEGDRSESHLAKVAWFCVVQLELERLENLEKQSINTPNNQATT